MWYGLLSIVVASMITLSIWILVFKYEHPQLTNTQLEIVMFKKVWPYPVLILQVVLISFIFKKYRDE